MSRDAKEKLSKSAEKMATIILIGSLEEFEKGFGDLFGHDLEEKDMTEDQKAMRKKWLAVRHNILDRGHDSLNYFLDILDRFTVTKYKYNYKFDLKDR